MRKRLHGRGGQMSFSCNGGEACERVCGKFEVSLLFIII